jgi:methyl-accepting chemotaxis protein
MNVGKRLMLCIAGMLAVVLGLAASGWYSNRSLATNLSFATSTVAIKINLGGQLSTHAFGMRTEHRGLLLYAATHQTPRIAVSATNFQKHYKEAQANLANLKPLISTPKDKEDIAAIESDIEQYHTVFGKMTQLVAEGKTMPAVDMGRDLAGPLVVRLEKELNDYSDVQNNMLQAVNAAAAQNIAAGHWVAIVFVVIGLAVVGLIAFIVRGITNQLRTITSNLSDAASQIADGSSQVSSSSQTLAQGSSEQASSLEETSASAEEVTSMTRQNAANTSQVAELMNTVDHRVSEGNSTLAQMIDSMKHINASSGKISKIIKVIDEIAFQTNILALNAAVEAARAGEAGMGFAVVADEVRNLAQRSAQAAKDTASLIEECSKQLQKVANVVGSITEAAAKVKVLVDEVNIGSQEQAKGIEEIARALSEMDKVTQGTAAAAEESASASQEMSAQAQALAHIVEELRVMAGRAV